MRFLFLSLTLLTSRVSADDHSALAFDWTPPSFTATTASGQEFTYPENLDGPTIVLFWATWCPYCKALMPHLQSIVDEYGGEVKVLALSFREDGDPVAYMDRYGYQFELFPGGDDVAESWGVKRTPGLFLADASGRVVFSRAAIPTDAYPKRMGDMDGLEHVQKASRRVPLWAAWLRQSLDTLIDGGPSTQEDG